MIMGQLKPTQVLNKAYRQIAVETTDFEHFKSALQILLDNVSDGQREETQKEHLRNFLSETFYKPYYTNGHSIRQLKICVYLTIFSYILCVFCKKHKEQRSTIALFFALSYIHNSSV